MTISLIPCDPEADELGDHCNHWWDDGRCCWCGTVDDNDRCEAS